MAVGEEVELKSLLELPENQVVVEVEEVVEELKKKSLELLESLVVEGVAEVGVEQMMLLEPVEILVVEAEVEVVEELTFFISFFLL